MSTEVVASVETSELSIEQMQDNGDEIASKTARIAPETADMLHGFTADTLLVEHMEYATAVDLETVEDADTGTLYVDPDTYSSLRSSNTAYVEPIPEDEIPSADVVTFRRTHGGPFENYPDTDLASYKEDVESYLRDQFQGAVVTENDRFVHPDYSEDVRQWMRSAYVVEDASPDGEDVVRIDLNTRIDIDWAEDTHTVEDQREITYDDVGGLDEEIEQVKEVVQYPLEDPDAHQAGDRAGVLLSGPPGTGKTLIAEAIANEVDATFYEAEGARLYKRFFSESERSIRNFMKKAEQEAPTIIFVDEMEGMFMDRDEASGSAGEAMQRAVDQWCKELDGMQKREDVYIIGATNREDMIDPAIKRNGRLDKTVNIGVPDTAGREEIFDIHTDGLPLADDVSLEALAEETDGYVGADIRQVCIEAEASLNRRTRRTYVNSEETPYEKVSEARDGEGLQFTMADFETAIDAVEPQEATADEPDHVGRTFQ